MTIALAVAMLLAGAGCMGWYLERDRRIAAERLAGTHWATVTPAAPAPPEESLEARALRIEGERTKVQAIDNMVLGGLSQREAERLWHTVDNPPKVL